VAASTSATRAGGPDRVTLALTPTLTLATQRRKSSEQAVRGIGTGTTGNLPKAAKKQLGYVAGKMTAPSFDPSRAVRFDLRSGTVQASVSSELLMVVPAAAMGALLRQAPPAAAEAFGRALGSAVGARAATRMGAPQSASIESFVTQLAGEAALAGLGLLGVERWGRALVVNVERSPLDGSLLVPILAAALEAAAGRQVSCALLAHDDRVTRVFVSSEDAVERLNGWLATGLAWGDALAKLQGDGQ
jgi:hypothetical protein